jgi:nitrate reductase gamma subunit
MFGRLQALLAALWGGFLLCVAFAAAPSAFAVLAASDAGLFVGRLFAVEAQVSLVAAVILMLLERRLARDASEAAGTTVDVFSARLLLPAVALFCTVAGYYGLQPMMADAKAGVGVASFGALHGASLALFGVKGLAVLALAWISQRRSS